MLKSVKLVGGPRGGTETAPVFGDYPEALTLYYRDELGIWLKARYEHMDDIGVYKYRPWPR